MLFIALIAQENHELVLLEILYERAVQLYFQPSWAVFLV
jgi:hypothetical protein